MLDRDPQPSMTPGQIAAKINAVRERLGQPPIDAKVGPGGEIVSRVHKAQPIVPTKSKRCAPKKKKRQQRRRGEVEKIILGVLRDANRALTGVEIAEVKALSDGYVYGVLKRMYDREQIDFFNAPLLDKQRGKGKFWFIVGQEASARAGYEHAYQQAVVNGKGDIASRIMAIFREHPGPFKSADLVEYLGLEQSHLNGHLRHLQHQGVLVRERITGTVGGGYLWRLA